MSSLPKPLAELFDALVLGLPQQLDKNLVTLCLYGSLTQRAFDQRASDADGLVVTRRNLSEREFARLAAWFATLSGNPWTNRLQLSILRQSTLLRPDQGACTFQFGKLVRTGSDGNPIPWLNALASGRTLYGPSPESFVPPIGPELLHTALLREAEYLREELHDRGSAWRGKPYYRAYALLTVCRILYTHATGRIASKPVAARWGLRQLPPRWHGLIAAALADRGPDSQAVLPLQQVQALVAECRQRLNA